MASGEGRSRRRIDTSRREPPRLRVEYAVAVIQYSVTAEGLHELGREGVLRIRRWLDATARFSMSHTAYDLDTDGRPYTQVRVEQLNGGFENFDLVVSCTSAARAQPDGDGRRATRSASSRTCSTSSRAASCCSVGPRLATHEFRFAAATWCRRPGRMCPSRRSIPPTSRPSPLPSSRSRATRAWRTR
jgi:hypothetical protein